MDYYKHSSKNKLIKIWYSMRSRCYNPKNKDYRLYGAKGIDICDEWLIYENFADWALDNGYYEGMSIDRINPLLGYSPENCEWVTVSENSRRRVITTPYTYTPSEAQKKHFSETTKRAYATDPTLRDRTKHLRDTNGRTKISVEKINEIKALKNNGFGWKDGFELLEIKVNVRYFRNVIWNKL